MKSNWPEIFWTLCSLANRGDHWAYNWAWGNTFIHTTSCSSNMDCNFRDIWTCPTINSASQEVQYYHITYLPHYRSSPSPWHTCPYLNPTFNTTNQLILIHPATPAHTLSSHTSSYLCRICKIQVLYQWSTVPAEDKKNIPYTWCSQTHWLQQSCHVLEFWSWKAEPNWNRLQQVAVLQTAISAWMSSQENTHMEIQMLDNVSWR